MGPAQARPGPLDSLFDQSGTNGIAQHITQNGQKMAVLLSRKTFETPLPHTSAKVVYHVLNRANARRTLFKGEGRDYATCGSVNWNLRRRKGDSPQGAARSYL